MSPTHKQEVYWYKFGTISGRITASPHQVNGHINGTAYQFAIVASPAIEIYKDSISFRGLDDCEKRMLEWVKSFVQDIISAAGPDLMQSDLEKS